MGLNILGNMKVTHISKCSCGAVTLFFENGASNSMFSETFDSVKGQLNLGDVVYTPDSCCCDHCVNHWGIDLCECGSGEMAGSCECGSDQSHDTLGVKFDSFAAILQNFG